MTNLVQNRFKGCIFKEMGRIPAFGMEMTRRGRYRGSLSPEIVTRPRCLETRTERGFPHFHTDDGYGGRSTSKARPE